ncbi:MAG: MBL fold metallo-hydrolase [Anaerolineae bacterium]
MLEQMTNTPIMDNSLALWGLGQMGFAVKGPDAMIYIDPCLSDHVAEIAGDWWYRAYPPPIVPEAVTNADYYFISHEHGDHLDPLTVAGIAQASPQARFVTNGWSRDILLEMGYDAERIITLISGERVQIDDTSMFVTAVPGAHYEVLHEVGKGYRWIGFLIEWNGVTLYHAGDTIIYPDYIAQLQAFPPIDLAIMPVNGRDYYRETVANAIGNLLPAEVAQLARDMDWDMLIPGHNDLYPNNAIPDSEIVSALSHYAPQQKYKLMKPAELYYYVKS